MPCRVPWRSRSSSSSCPGRPRLRWTPSGGGAATSPAAPSPAAGPRTPAGASSKVSRKARMAPLPLEVLFSSPLLSFTPVKHHLRGADLRSTSLNGLPKAELLLPTVSRMAHDHREGMIADEDVKVEQPQQGQPQGQQQGQQQPATWFSLMQPYLSAAQQQAQAQAQAPADAGRPGNGFDPLTAWYHFHFGQQAPSFQGSVQPTCASYGAKLAGARSPPPPPPPSA